jgi:hypothetical protein
MYLKIADELFEQYLPLFLDQSDGMDFIKIRA